MAPPAPCPPRFGSPLRFPALSAEPTTGKTQRETTTGKKNAKTMGETVHVTMAELNSKWETFKKKIFINRHILLFWAESSGSPLVSSRCLKHSVVHKYLHLFLRLVHNFLECFMATLWSTNHNCGKSPCYSWLLLCPKTFCDGSYFVQTLFAMDPTLSKDFLRWILLCPNTFCDGSYFV